MAVTVSPGTGQYPYGPVTLPATPNAGAIFTDWRVDGVVTGWSPTLNLTVDALRTVEARFAARPTCADVGPSGVAWDAITQLAARGIIKGYGNGTFGPGDTLVRAQMAALITRALGWDGGTPGGPAPFADLGEVDPELQRAIAILAQRGIINGYGDGTFGPTDEVRQAQVISFLARSMVQAGYCTAVTQDAPNLYPNVPLSSGHRLDLLTFVKYAGALPDHPQGQARADWTTPALRGWTAQALFAVAVAGFLARAALNAILGAVFLVVYLFYFVILSVRFIPVNILLALVVTRLARRDATEAQAAGTALARRNAWGALGIGALVYLAIFLIGISAVTIRDIVARAS